MLYSVLVTGANRGIGLAFCKHYLKEDYKVLATCRNPDNAAELHALQAHHKDRLTLHQLDICSSVSILRLKQDLNNMPLDLLINNAGISAIKGSFTDFVDQLNDAEALQKMTQRWLTAFNTNVVGPVMLTLMLLPNLEKGSKKKVLMLSSRKGSITNHAQDINTSSNVYRSTKSALNSAANCLAIGLKPKEINLLLLHPGWVRTDMGGNQADIDVDTSVAGMAQVIATSQPSKALQLLSYRGEVIPW
ncbi:MAG: SDR family oxidoreductase [Endozoicomonadaceae bacterium]|nr:SDR family oxidoreductase [Endozoicomonadaceae bacterium]